MSLKKVLLIVLLTSITTLSTGIFAPNTARAKVDKLSPAPAFATMSRISREVQLSPTSDPEPERYHPTLAHNYNRNEYLVVWHNTWPSGKRDIYARRISTSGQVLSWFCVTTGTNDRFQPSVAYNAANDEYLIVWMYEASPDVYEIWGKIIPWNGPGTNTEFRIIQWTNRSFWTPRVAWNSWRNEYLVVWNAFNTTTSFPPGIPNDIAGYRISASGTIYSPESPLSLTTYASPHQVDLTYNIAMDEYFLAFVVVHTQATTGNDIYGLRVSWAGSPVTPPGLIHIDDSAKNQNAPAVATNEQDRYMVVWEHEYNTADHDIYGREYKANGDPVGSYFTIASWTQDDTNPDIAANGANNEWLAVWQQSLPAGAGYAIKGFRWGQSGVKLYMLDVASYAFWDNESPAVAADIPGYLIVYEGDSSITHRHIYGRLWWPEAVYLPVVLRSAQ